MRSYKKQSLRLRTTPQSFSSPPLQRNRSLHLLWHYCLQKKNLHFALGWEKLKRCQQCLRANHQIINQECRIWRKLGNNLFLKHFVASGKIQKKLLAFLQKRTQIWSRWASNTWQSCGKGLELCFQPNCSWKDTPFLIDWKWLPKIKSCRKVWVLIFHFFVSTSKVLGQNVLFRSINTKHSIYTMQSFSEAELDEVVAFILGAENCKYIVICNY